MKTFFKPLLVTIACTLMLTAMCSNELTHEFIKQEILEQIQKLRAQGINAVDHQGRTPLFIAAQNNQAELIIELLQNKDIDIDKADKDGLTPLAIAVNEGNKEAVQALLDFSDIDKCKSIEQKDSKLHHTPLARAAITGHEGIIKLLLDRGANPTAVITREGKDITASDLYTQEDKDIKELLAKSAKEYADRSLAFIRALHAHEPARGKKLLALGIDVNAKDKDGYTPLHLAAWKGHEDIVQFLIEYKSDVNAKDEMLSTALHAASRASSLEIVEMLIKIKANVNAKDYYENTPLHSSAASRHALIAQLLIDNKADVNAKNKWGETPLHYAADKGYQEVVTMLIDNKADVSAQDNNHDTPLHRAYQYQYFTTAQLLIEAKADINAKNKSGDIPE